MFKNLTKSRNFRIVAGLLLFACCGASWFNGNQIRQQEALDTTQTNIAKFTQVVIAVSEQAAATQTASQWTATPTDTPSVTPSETPIPLPTNTPAPTDIPPTAQPPTIPASTDTPIPPSAAPARTFYVTSAANIRPCPRTSTDCTVIRQLTSGQTVQVIGEEQGELVNNSALWYKLDDGNYVHSGVVSTSAPVQAQQSSGSGSTSSGGGFATIAPAQSTPRNCSTAVAMGLTAQQAAQYSHLDQDGDGVACYGD